MTVLLLLLQLDLFAFPITNAYAIQHKTDTLVSITYTTVIPRHVCVEAYNLSNTEMSTPDAAHCWTPNNVIGDVDVWPEQDINDVNFRVVVQYPDGEIVIINLTTILNT